MPFYFGHAKSQVRPQTVNGNKNLTQRSLIRLVVRRRVPIWWLFIMKIANFMSIRIKCPLAFCYIQTYMLNKCVSTNLDVKFVNMAAYFFWHSSYQELVFRSPPHESWHTYGCPKQNVNMA